MCGGCEKIRLYSIKYDPCDNRKVKIKLKIMSKKIKYVKAGISSCCFDELCYAYQVKCKKVCGECYIKFKFKLPKCSNKFYFGYETNKTCLKVCKLKANNYCNDYCC